MSLADWRDWQVPDVETAWCGRDAVLYALGTGCGAGDADDLRFVLEPVPVALPTLATVIGTPGFWLMDPAYGLDWPAILHGEQGLRLHRPLPVEGQAIGRTRIDGVFDRGAGRGALMRVTRQLVDAGDGLPIATLTELWVLRGDGGTSGETSLARPTAPTMPTRAPDRIVDRATTRQSALIYRLSGDTNPLHVDPVIARRGGFARPILHGLASYGLVARALLTLCDGDPARLRAIDARFTAPVYPGETVRTEMWRDATDIAFRARVMERDVIVLDHGRAEIA